MDRLLLKIVLNDIHNAIMKGTRIERESALHQIIVDALFECDYLNDGKCSKYPLKQILNVWSCNSCEKNELMPIDE